VDVLASPLAAVTLAPDGAELVLVEWLDPGGDPDDPQPLAPFHVHHHDDEAWYVLEGALGFRVGTDEVVAYAGDAVIVPHGTPHTFWNATAGPCRYLIAMTREIKAIIDDVHAAEDRSREAVREIFRRHDSDLVD
jgi:mannose-6-phosphate isomerase-like protein (cupin superfamily)